MIGVLRQNLPALCFKNSAYLIRQSHLGFETHIVPPLRLSTSADGKGEDGSSFLYEFLVQKHHFSPQSASHIASAVPCLRNPARSVSVLSFLKENGFSNSQLEKMVTVYPQFLSGDLEKTIKPKIKILQDFNLSQSYIARMITKDPWMFRRSFDNRLIPNLVLLRDFLGSIDLAKLLKYSNVCLCTNLDNTLFPNVELLKNCGVSMDQIIWNVYHKPWFIFSNQERMKTYVGKADAMGVSRNSRQFITAARVIGEFKAEDWERQLRTVGELGFSEDDVAAAFRRSPTVFGLSKETWKLKLRTLRELGFSVGDIARAFRQHPMLFTLSPENIKKTTEILLANGKYDILCIVSCPGSLNYSVEKRYKPRMQVLELLEGKNLIQSWPSFSMLCKMTDKEFNRKYVAPFLNKIGDDHIAKRITRG